jgi:hypothetical protein
MAPPAPDCRAAAQPRAFGPARARERRRGSRGCVPGSRIDYNVTRVDGAPTGLMTTETTRSQTHASLGVLLFLPIFSVLGRLYGDELRLLSVGGG